jgi:hypothetical protein
MNAAADGIATHPAKTMRSWAPSFRVHRQTAKAHYETNGRPLVTLLGWQISSAARHPITVLEQVIADAHPVFLQLIQGH